MTFRFIYEVAEISSLESVEIPWSELLEILIEGLDSLSSLKGYKSFIFAECCQKGN